MLRNGRDGHGVECDTYSNSHASPNTYSCHDTYAYPYSNTYSCYNTYTYPSIYSNTYSRHDA